MTRLPSAIIGLLTLIVANISIAASEINPSLSFNPRTEYKGTPDDYVGIPISVLEANCTASKMQNHNITYAGWFRIQYPTYEVTATQNPDASLLSINDIVKAHLNSFENGLRIVVDGKTRCLKLVSDTTGSSNKGSLLFKKLHTQIVMPENEWHFIGISLDSKVNGIGTSAYTNVGLYFDGVKIAETTKRSFLAWYNANKSVEPWFIAGGFGLNGAVDDIYISTTVALMTTT